MSYAEAEVPKPPVKGRCQRCEQSKGFVMRTVAMRGGGRLTPGWQAVVSPRGLEHVGADYGMTLCGIDATGERWWWEL